MKTLATLFFHVLLFAVALLWIPSAAEADNPYCYNHLDRTTYGSGFSESDFSVATDVNVKAGRLTLTTDDKELGDTNNITIRTQQELKIYYVFESAGGSHTLGWFLFDDNVKKYLHEDGWNTTSETCFTNNDCDMGMECVDFSGTRYCSYRAYSLRDDGTAGGKANNKVYDWFEDLYESDCPSCVPKLLQWPYSDGGIFNSIPNLLEDLVTKGGGWIFLLCDDDTDLVTGGGSNPILPPRADVSATNDGIPDYDVNEDGVIDYKDRLVELGTFDSGAELVFFITMFYDQRMRRASAGIENCSGGICVEDTNLINTKIIPFFSKRVLNPDYKDSGDHHIDRNIGCGFPSWCGGYQGWLAQATLNRLENDFGLVMPHEIKRINVRKDGQIDHMFLGAPSTDPTWWLLGFEDLYDGGDVDYNDVVFLVWRTNGGEVVSEMIANEIPVDALDDTTITKIKITKKDVIPKPPCSDDPESARIDYYISISKDINGNHIWVKVEFPADSPDEVIVDLQDMGYTGSQLHWKAVIISDNHKCQPYIESIDVGYEALKHGEYVFSSPLPIANVMYRGANETPHKDWTVTGNDRSNRGRFKAFELYSPTNPENETMMQIWDAGELLAARDPNTRDIYTNKEGTSLEFKAESDNWLHHRVLTEADRARRHNGRPVYDFTGDSLSGDDDARWLIEWTRGWEQPKTQQRAWKLGAINSSTGAIVHVPGEPRWIEREGIPVGIKTSYRAWAEDPAQAERRTIAVVGSQSGMIHAFDAGAFRWGNNPNTEIMEQRGYFKFEGATPNYGSGREEWAFIPESLLNKLKNNKVKNYYPEENPMAMVDGSISVTDIYWKNTWKTAIFASMGRHHPYITAVDLTQPLSPQPLWDSDWTDPDFHGTTAAPSVSWVDRGSAGTEGKTWMAATGSGLASTPSDVYLYMIDLETGKTMTNGKVKLNVGGGIRDERAYGIAGRPVLLDFSGDGYTDRVYVADTNGRIWKHEPNRDPGNSCMVASLGQHIYTTPTISLQHDYVNGETVVSIYVGTSDRPDADDIPDPPYYFYALADRDTQTECSIAEVLFEKALPPDEKVWADAVLATDRVYVGTSTGAKAHICDEDPNNPGSIYVFDINPGPDGQAIELADPIAAGGSVIAGLMVHDEHIFANTLGGKTNIIGGSSWNNLASYTDTAGLREVYWQEVFNVQ